MTPKQITQLIREAAVLSGVAIADVPDVEQRMVKARAILTQLLERLLGPESLHGYAVVFFQAALLSVGLPYFGNDGKQILSVQPQWHDKIQSVLTHMCLEIQRYLVYEGKIAFQDPALG